MVSTVFSHRRTFADQAVFQTINLFDSRVFQKDAMFHNRRKNPASIAYRGKRPDKRIVDLNFIPDDHRSSDRAPGHLTVFSQANSPTHLAFPVDLSEKLSLDPLVQYNAVGRQKVVFLSGIKPPTV